MAEEFDESEETVLQIVDEDNVSESGSQRMEIESDSEAQGVARVLEVAEEKPEVLVSPEALEKSKIQKESFMEMFRIAPRIRDILPDLRVFISHPDVIDADRTEVEALVEAKIQEEKAKKKAEKASKKEKEQQLVLEKSTIPLADVIRSATGIDLAGILQKIHPDATTTTSVPPPVPVGVIPGAVPITPIPGIPHSTEVLNLVGPTAVMPVVPAIQPNFKPLPAIDISGGSKIASIGHGKAGFSTPHPNEIPKELRLPQSSMIAPIPDELKNIAVRKNVEVPAIPIELLPPEQRVLQSLSVAVIRPPMRKTLFLAGARSGKKSERNKTEKEKNAEAVKGKKPIDENDTIAALNRSLPPGVEPYPSPEKRRRNGRGRGGRGSGISAINSLPQGLNKNSPLAVKRYHARQLARETGMTLEEAMTEIEEQCKEFGGEDTPEAREHDEIVLEYIKKKGDADWNQRHKYVPVDHSKGIPGVDRPPAGLQKENDIKKDNEQDCSQSPIQAVVNHPLGDRAPVPGDKKFPKLPTRDHAPIPGFDRPPGEDRRVRRERGGVKERRKRMRREEMLRGRGARGGRGGRGGWDGRDHCRDYGDQPSYKAGRYEEQRADPYEDYYSQSRQYPPGRERYDDQQYYDDRGYERYEDPYQQQDDYYGRQDGYEGYDQHHYGHEQHGGGEGYEEYQQGAEEYYGHEATYYQEDGSQYYNDYYGTAAEAGGSATEYNATFDPPPSGGLPPPAPPSSSTR